MTATKTAGYQGSGWTYGTYPLRVAHRSHTGPNNRGNTYGFRYVSGSN